MEMYVASVLILIFQAYVGIGVIVALLFLLWGIDRIDDAAHHSYLFRLLLIPGVVGIWPLVLHRWRQLEVARRS